jgi:uncharacterized protein YbjT (DUF2867 family)
MRIAVAGGTGVVGRHLVTALGAAGHEPVVLARSVGVHLTTGGGLGDALREVEVVVDVSNVTTTRRAVAERFFGAAARHLLDAGARAGVGHHVVLSIVGVDRVDQGYYEGKRLQERLVLDGPVPASVLRATQFHEFAGQLLQRLGRSPVVAVPRMLSQPIAASEVAEALVDLALAEPAGRVPDLAGPRREEMPDLVRRLLRSRGSRRPVLPLPLPGRVGRGMAGGGLLPTGDGPRGRVDFDAWLAGSSDLAADPREQ